MTRNNKSIGAAIGAMLLFGALASPASARWGDHDEHRGERHDWKDHHYRSPPVVYGGYYGYRNGYYPPPVGYYGDRYGYYPPPVVYGPGIGIYLPGVNLNIR